VGDEGVLVMELLGLWIWVASIAAGVIIASQRNNAPLGFFLCLMLGPIGMVACAFIDARVRCPQCGTPLNDAPAQCPSCWARFRWNKQKTRCEFVAYEFRREAQPPKPAGQ
jgi:hypothetical protein